MTVPSPGSHGRGQITKKKDKTFKNLLYSHTYIGKKNLMHNYDVYEALSQNYEIYGPGSGVQAVGQDQYKFYVNERIIL